ncbi:MAG: glycosyl hydrolase 115 family protein [Bacteroides thetaiotaomicron]
MRILFLLVVLSVTSALQSQVVIKENAIQSKYAFPLVTSKAKAVVVYDTDDYLVVRKTAELFVSDVESVTGQQLRLTDKLKGDKEIIIVGTVEKNRLIRQLAEKGKLDISSLEGTWERFLIQTVSRPFPGVSKALVVAGSDRRGAAYGLFSLSEMMGVSPWYWWADVPVKKHKTLYVDAPATLSKTPSVKYRGIFLNDEDWGLKPWAAKTFEKERGNIGPRTYAKICELLLRLKANHLAPAMHPVSTAFYKIPENKLVADTFAIVMGSSHCEPLLLNTASEWDSKTMGPWDYNKNKDKINEVLSNRVKENCAYENVYTLALRGLHDAAMGGGDVPMREKVKMLESALNAQREIIARHIDKPVETIPQAFTPYKEVLEIYSNGLELPDDVTIIWADDNFGYMKRLSGPQEQKRSGRAGVYYHISYLGVPHSYLWYSTTPPALMYEELRKAYDTTADRVWLANCGDLKWKHMMSLKQNYDGTSSYFMIPLMEEEYTPVGFPKLGLQAESENLDKGGMSFHTLPAYSTYSRKSHWIDIYNQGTGELSWSITPSEDWILISQKSGKTSAENRIYISVDWDKVPAGEKVKGQIDITSGTQKETVLVSVFNPESPARTEVQGLYVEENGYISIPAADFHRKFESNDIRMSILPGLGFEGRSLQLGNPTAPLQMYRAGDVPRVEYDFYTFNAGIYDVYTYVLPTFPLHAERDYKLPEHTNSDTKYSVRIDDGSISTPSTSAIEYSQIWYDSVLKNCRVNKSTLYVKKPGKHTLQIRCGDPGVVIQKIVIDLGGMKRSYLGPQSTICN